MGHARHSSQDQTRDRIHENHHSRHLVLSARDVYIGEFFLPIPLEQILIAWKDPHEHRCRQASK